MGSSEDALECRLPPFGKWSGFQSAGFWLAELQVLSDPAGIFGHTHTTTCLVLCQVGVQEKAGHLPAVIVVKRCFSFSVSISSTVTMTSGMLYIRYAGDLGLCLFSVAPHALPSHHL